LAKLRKLVAVGKISGAVGMYTLDPRIEKLVCEQLGLKPIIATQIISRDIIAEYMTTLALIGGTIEKICVNIRTLQRTEILEAQEYFSPRQRGSSAMPHKRNPISSENLSGMARVLRGYAITAMENQNTWDERDLANSGPERIILADASILLDYMIARLTKIIKRWVIYPEKMIKNRELTKGLIFSQEVQALVAKKSGLPREDAYKLVRDIAQACWDTSEDFQEKLLNDKHIMAMVTVEELCNCFNIQNKVRYVDYIFEQVFRKEEKE
jgi:adenylosuccinate lyase